jgi:DNA modification methylase
MSRARPHDLDANPRGARAKVRYSGRVIEVIAGDNLEAMRRLITDRALGGKVALAYLDPPFGTGRDFGAYDDRWAEGRKGLVESLRPRLEAIHSLLSSDGSILVHLDHRIAHVIALVLDDLFGAGDRDRKGGAGFRNEIIWTYGLGGSSSRFYPRKHDTILWYTKGDRWTFDPPKIPARSQRLKGKHKKQLDVLVGPPSLDAIDDARDSLLPSDVWDVAAINNMARERTGYPTQKPIVLLERLVAAHSREDDLVLDPYCGSGTTLVAAKRLGRRAIGIDASPEAVRIARERLDRA